MTENLDFEVIVPAEQVREDLLDEFGREYYRLLEMAGLPRDDRYAAVAKEVFSLAYDTCVRSAEADPLYGHSDN